MEDIGIISGRDMTVEATTSKLAYLLGKEFPTEKIKEMM